MKLRRNHFVPTWRIFISYVVIIDFLRRNESFQARKLFGNPRNSLIFATFVVDIGSKPLIIIRTL